MSARDRGSAHLNGDGVWEVRAPSWYRKVGAGRYGLEDDCVGWAIVCNEPGHPSPFREITYLGRDSDGDYHVGSDLTVDVDHEAPSIPDLESIWDIVESPSGQPYERARIQCSMCQATNVEMRLDGMATRMVLDALTARVSGAIPIDLLAAAMARVRGARGQR